MSLYVRLRIPKYEKTKYSDDVFIHILIIGERLTFQFF